jgi:universal stress protein A
MATYQKILVAVDLSSESEVVLQKAQLIAGPNAEIYLVYVQEPMDNVYVGIVPQSAAFSGLGDLEAQLGIVIGTHGQKGLQLLLGSTANAVLHGAGCDVLSVRIGAAK